MNNFTNTYRFAKKSFAPFIGLLVFAVITACTTAKANSPVVSEISTTPQVKIEQVQLVPQPTNQEKQMVQPNPLPMTVPEENPVVVEDAPQEAANVMGGGGVPLSPDSSASENAASAQDAAALTLATPTSSVQVAQELTLEVKPEVGFLAPDFTLQTMDGQVIKLSDLRGRSVVISYWATWCEPCKQELPILQQMSKEYADSGLQFITIDAIEQDNADHIQPLLDQLGVTLPVLLDQQNQFQSAYKQLFFPTSYFIDPNGMIRFIKLGDAKETELRTKVEQLVNNQL
jgi:cytochrome c biogenesis protein CcmG, thiol:disulfide interchange protein DsbE